MTTRPASTPRAPPTSALHSGFGATHLAKLGWSHGQGLGKAKQGMTTHIRVSRKQDKGGISAKKEDFGFQWWDHLYNKSAVSVTLDKEENEQEEEEEEAVPEPKKVDPLMAMFVKSDRASEDVHPDKIKKASKRPTKKVDGDKDNYCIPMTDAELLAICEGRTAAKGARFDYSSAGKVVRADTELGQKLVEIGVAAAPGLPTPSPSPVPVGAADTTQVDEEEGDKKEKSKKKKRKRARDAEGEEEEEARRARKRAKKEAKRKGDAGEKKKKSKKRSKSD